ncbi:hypothetical protein GCM10023221_10160 [Luteimicrobium xylanilyticum]
MVPYDGGQASQRQREPGVAAVAEHAVPGGPGQAAVAARVGAPGAVVCRADAPGRARREVGSAAAARRGGDDAQVRPVRRMVEHAGLSGA